MSYTARMDRSESWHTRQLAVIVGAFLGIRGVLFAGGLRFDANPVGQIHLLDLGQLHADPFLAFTSMHIQPPLFNFFIGGVLAWSPLPSGISFQLLYLAMGLTTVLALWRLLLGLGARLSIATAATVIVACSPLMIRNEAVLTYETPTTTIVVLSAWTFLRYVRRPWTSALAVFACTLVVGVLTRTTLNPIWFLGAVVLVVLARPPGRAWRPVAAVVAGAVVLVAIPAVHNQVRFDTLGYSSFVGMNLSRTTVMQLPRDRLDELIARGDLSPAAAVLPYSTYDDYVDIVGACEAASGSPVLDDVTKATSGDRNLNATCYLPVYRLARHDAVAALRADPAVYARAVAASVLIYQRWDVHAAEPDAAVWGWWSAIYAPLAVPVPLRWSPLGPDSLPAARAVTEMADKNRLSLTVAVGLALAVGYGIVGLARIRRRRDDPVAWTRVYIAFTVVCVSAVAVLFDTFENARFREPLDPLLLGPLWVLVLEGLGRGWARMRRRRGRGSRHVGPTQPETRRQPG